MSRTRRKGPGGPYVDGYDPTRDHDSFGRGAPSYLREHLGIGPGGPGCACCFPAPRKRKGKIRAAKKAEKRRAMREALEDE